MRAVERIFKNEPVEDVLTLFALNSGIPSLDRMYGTYRPEVRDSGEFLATYQKLFDEGVLVRGPRGPALKGPNWKAPKFVFEKKYADDE